MPPLDDTLDRNGYHRIYLIVENIVQRNLCIWGNNFRFVTIIIMFSDASVFFPRIVRRAKEFREKMNQMYPKCGYSW